MSANENKENISPLGFRQLAVHLPVWEVLWKGTPWRLIHTSIFGKNPEKGLQASLPLQSHPFAAHVTSQERALDLDMGSLEIWNQWFDSEEYSRAKRYALWSLSRKNTHSYFLRKKLLERLVQEKTVQKIIDELSSKGYLDDQAWLAHYIEQRQKRMGRRLIIYQLRSKGLPQETIEAFLQEHSSIEEASEREKIAQLLQTKYRKKNVRDDKTRRSLIASLLRKGYCLDDIRAAMASLSRI